MAKLLKNRRRRRRQEIPHKGRFQNVLSHFPYSGNGITDRRLYDDVISTGLTYTPVRSWIRSRTLDSEWRKKKREAIDRGEQGRGMNKTKKSQVTQGNDSLRDSSDSFTSLIVERHRSSRKRRYNNEMRISLKNS